MKSSSKSPGGTHAENGIVSTQQPTLSMPPLLMPPFHVSPTRGAPQKMIGEGGLVASRSQVIQQRKVVSTTSTMKSASHTQLAKMKKKKKSSD